MALYKAGKVLEQRSRAHPLRGSAPLDNEMHPVKGQGYDAAHLISAPMIAAHDLAHTAPLVRLQYKRGNKLCLFRRGVGGRSEICARGGDGLFPTDAVFYSCVMVR